MNIVDTLVVTPSLGERESLNTTIESVRLYGGRRTYHLIVGPIEKLSRFKKKYPWIYISNLSSRGGVYFALNYALALYGNNYPFFAYINDDDCWSQNYSCLFRLMDANQDLDLCYGRVDFVQASRPVKIGPFFPFPRFYSSLLKFGVPLFTQQAVLVKTKCVLEANSFNEELPLSADSDLWARLIAAGIRVQAINKVCAFYKMDGDRLSSQPDIIARDMYTRSKGGDANRRMFYDWLALFLYRLYNIPVYFLRNVFLLHSIMKDLIKA